MVLPSRERKRPALALLAARLCRPHAEESNAHGVQPPDGERRLRIGDILEKMCLGDLLREEDDAPGPFDPVNEAAVTTPERRSGDSRRGGSRRSEEKAVSSSSSPSRPRCLLSRWLPSKQFLKCRVVSDGEYDEEEVAEEQDVAAETACGRGSGVFSLRSEVGASTLLSAGRGAEAAALASASRGGQDEGIKAKDSDFVRNPEQQITFLNVGMGASLVFLLTRSITEFNRMTELRREVEILLGVVKDAVQKHDLTSPPNPVGVIGSKSPTTLALSYSDSWGGDTEEVTQQANDHLLRLPQAPSDVGPERDHTDAKSLEYHDQMQISELESELQVLQLNYLEDKRDSELGQTMTELSDIRTQVSDSFSAVNLHVTGPKERVEKEASTRYQFGVCPHELTRRLHELLEARQEERITELESALQLAHIKLREKEMEASWWRDTARLASQHDHESLLR